MTPVQSLREWIIQWWSYSTEIRKVVGEITSTSVLKISNKMNSTEVNSQIILLSWFVYEMLVYKLVHTSLYVHTFRAVVVGL